MNDHHELQEFLENIKEEIKSWKGEDVNQHHARLNEYRKQTSVLHEILRVLRGLRR